MSRPKCSRCGYYHDDDETCEDVLAEVAEAYGKPKPPSNLTRLRAVLREAIKLINEMEPRR